MYGYDRFLVGWVDSLERLPVDAFDKFAVDETRLVVLELMMKVSSHTA